MHTDKAMPLITLHGMHTDLYCAEGEVQDNRVFAFTSRLKRGEREQLHTYTNTHVSNSYHAFMSYDYKIHTHTLK